MIRLDIDPAPFRGLADYVRGVVAQVRDTAELVKSWGPKLVAWQQDNIFRGTSPDGVPFLALSRAYANWREGNALLEKPKDPGPRFFGSQHARKTKGRTAHPFGVRPLIDTTAMVATMAWHTPGPNEVTGGATVKSAQGAPYPLFHQEGRGVPARPWSGLSKANVGEIEADTVLHISKALDRAVAALAKAG